jgi:dephospho-CoA kinase
LATGIGAGKGTLSSGLRKMVKYNVPVAEEVLLHISL